MAKDKPGFYVWFQTVDQMAELTIEEKGLIYSAAEAYAREGTIPTFEDRTVRTVWKKWQADLDADDAKYEENRRNNQIKGWKSDFKRNYAPAHGIDPNDEAALEAYIQQRLTTVDNGEQMSTNNNINNNSNSSINSNNNTSNSSIDKGMRETKRDNGFFPNGEKTAPSYHPLVSASDLYELDAEIERKKNHVI